MANYNRPPPPSGDDIRHDDLEYNPALEPKYAKAWINLLTESEKAFENWNDHCDKIEKQFANLEELASDTRDKEYAMFWANIEVIKPSIYARAPIPVVTPKFMDKRPVYQAASEFLERCAVVAFDLARVNDLMIQARNDVVLVGRGVAWCRYQSAGDGYYDSERVCIDFKHRRDFLHSVSRTWQEVDWVAAASYLTRGEARNRFKEYSGDEYQNAEYKVDKDSKEVGGADGRERAQFWEIWHKGERRVVWVAKGCEMILDEDKPHLDLLNFFPCPQPAYGTVQPGSLVPVPDMAQYRDQLDEVNLLTARIHALSDALEAKGFYPSGGGEIGEAVQAAMAHNTPGRLLVPIANWAAFGGTKEVIIWLPIDMIAQTITALVALRKEVISDIYQITGLSDIMRGSTNPNETLGAQELKSEYGSVRIRDKQQELVRLARDLVEIATGIITEKFATKTMIEMTQTDLPTQQMVNEQMQQLLADMNHQQQQFNQVQQIMQLPQVQQKAQQSPQIVQQMQQQFQQLQQLGQETMKKLKDKPTLEQVIAFLKNNRIKSFVLDIETDSTIQSMESAEKKARTEFTAVLAQLLPQLSQMIQAEPKTAEFCGEMLKFTTAPFRAGRALDGAISNLVDLMKQKSDQPKGDDPTTQAMKTQMQIEQMKDQTNQKKIQMEAESEQAKLQAQSQQHLAKLENDKTLKQMELNAKQGDDAAKANVQNQKLMENREAHQAHMLENAQTMQLSQQKADLAVQAHQAKQEDFQKRADERAAMQQFKMTNPTNSGGPL